MASIEKAAPLAQVATAEPARSFVLFAYAATLFLSALLIFVIQPMFTKMVLPKLGGAPAVWSVAMVVFQTALFLGYVYAHLLARLLKPGHAAVAHLFLLAAVAATLPLGIAKGFGTPPEHGVALWVTGLFFVSIGLPFAALAASAPLLQTWFVATGHRQAANPYVLYAASNLGSFAALIAYPFVIEPLFALKSQISLWSGGFYALAMMIAVAGSLGARSTAEIVDNAEVGPRPSARQCLIWTLLAAIPSALVIAVTAHISTDIAAAPFLWVLPLALYLLTFVAVFRDRPWLDHTTAQRLLPFAIVPLAVNAFGGDKIFWWVVIALILFVFVLIALVCHGEAYRTRPHRGRLTEFYLWIAFGGAIGGVFAGLIAPNVFNNTYEYPLLIAAALLILPTVFEGGWPRFLRDGGPVLVTAAVIAVFGLVYDMRQLLGLEPSKMAFIAVIVLVAAFAAYYRYTFVRYFGVLVLALVITRVALQGAGAITTVRSFFGVHQVTRSPDDTHYILMHGTTIHGAIRVRDEAGNPVQGRPEPLTYYYFGGPLSQAVEAARGAQGSLKRVAVVGLGAGSMACHRRDDEQWTFFEIDPEVVRIARNPNLFRFLSVCAPNAEVVLGDARLTLPAAPGQYEMIILDAFSSDAIPVHLLTREAFAGYLSRLAPNGVIAVHVSNRHMELASVVAAAGALDGLVAYLKQDTQANDFRHDLHANAHVVVLARKKADLGDLPTRDGWRPVTKISTVWTDDYSDVLSAIFRKKFSD